MDFRFRFKCCKLADVEEDVKYGCYKTKPSPVFISASERSDVSSYVKRKKPGCPKDLLAGLSFHGDGVVAHFCAYGLKKRKYKDGKTRMRVSPKQLLSF